MKKQLLLPLALLCCTTNLTAEKSSPIDTTRVVNIEEIVIISSPKENIPLHLQPTASTLISPEMLQAHQVNSLKNISNLAPNFFMADYGSSLTSAIYIRGIGSRINTPAVGLYVDNIPYLDKSAFDFNFLDIERVDVLRGPQGTLYGRNTMGGLIKVHTRNPFNSQGTQLKLSGATGDNSYSMSFSHNQKINERIAFSAGGYYQGARGFFKNEYLDRWADPKQAGGGRIRILYKPTDNWKLDLNVNYDYTDEGGYAYRYTGVVSGPETAEENIGHIRYNEKSSYRRSLLSTGLNAERSTEHFTLNAITGFQNLNDRMFMDQDFSPASIYTLEQKQRLNAISEEITMKSKNNGNWQWATGLFGFYQNLRTEAPVNFNNDGMDMLSSAINSSFDKANETMNPMGMHMSATLNNPSMNISGIFKTPVVSGAVFHQSTFNNLLTEGLSLTVGMRLEHERLKMNYLSECALAYDFLIESQRMPITLENLSSTPVYNGEIKENYTQLLPKIALKYDFDSRNNIYVSVAKGYRSGGYNIQMFNELQQSKLRNEMMTQVKDGCNAELDKYQGMGMPAAIIDMIKGYMELIPITEVPEVKSLTYYKPEYTWSYEIGTHLLLFNGKLQADASIFYMDTHDQQISKFVASGLGRMMVNAGRSESYGAELGLSSKLTRSLALNLNYGYTHATFKKYDGGINSSNEVIDYSGNYVPFVPQHTLNIGGSYTLFCPRSSFLESIVLKADYTGAGSIYWTESNSAHQNFYGTLNSYISFRTDRLQVDFWGRNLTEKKYDTFYFESMNKGFAQNSKPRQFGMSITLDF